MKLGWSLLLALAAVPAHAQLYKWTDASGKVHYSDRPQDGAHAQQLKVERAAPAATAAPAADDWRQRDREARERRIRQDQAEREAEAAAARRAEQLPYNPSAHRSDKPMTDEEVCARDAQQIAYSEKVKKLAFTGSGGTVAVSEEERQAIVRQRKENHALLCGPNQRKR